MRKNTKAIKTIATSIKVSEDKMKRFNDHVNNALPIGNKRFANIPIDLLYADERFQRVNDHSRTKIRMIKDNWNPLKMDALRVSPHSEMGMFSVIDGFHRLSAAKLAGIDYLPCEIICGLSTDMKERLIQEASIFATQDDEKEKLTPQQKHNANIIRNIPENVILQKMAEKYDIMLRPSEKAKGLAKIGQLQGFNAALKVARSGEEYLDRTFNVIIEARWNMTMNGLSQQVIYAVSNIFKLHKDNMEMCEKGMIEYFRKIQPEKFFAEAMTMYPERKEMERNTLVLEDYLVNVCGVKRVYSGGVIAA